MSGVWSNAGLKRFRFFHSVILFNKSKAARRRAAAPDELRSCYWNDNNIYRRDGAGSILTPCCHQAYALNHSNTILWLERLTDWATARSERAERFRCGPSWTNLA